MHGNVWEWTSTPVGGSKTLVGGSARSTASECSANAGSRRWAPPDQGFPDAGMRILAFRDEQTEADLEREFGESLHAVSPDPRPEPQKTLVLKKPGEPGKTLVLKTPGEPQKTLVPKAPGEPPKQRPGLLGRIRNLFKQP